jgi:zinc protease
VWLGVGGLAACAGSAPPPPEKPAGVDVQYEAAGKPDGGALAAAVAPPAPPDYWKDRKDLILSPPPPVPAELTLPKVDRWKLKNGLEVIVVARKDLPVASFSLAIKAGGYDEEKGKTLGVADFTASMLRKGTQTRSADQISQAIDFVGGSLETQAGNESSAAGCTSLSKDAKLCLDLLSDILIRPSFPEAEMADVRDQLLAGLSSRYDNPGELANAHFDNLLFGEKHPEGWVLTPDDVQAIKREQLLAFWKTFYRPNNAILAVAGDVDAARLRVDLEKAFGAWEKADVPERPYFKVPEVKSTRILLVDRADLTQSTVVFGHAGIKHIDPAWYAVTLMNYVLGGSDFSSRLMIEVRAKRGLTYGISSSFGASLYEGAFRVSASTKNSSVWDALVAAVGEIRRMKAEGPTAEELAKAKGYYAGSYPFSLQSAPGIADHIVAAELHGLGLAYVKQFPLRIAAVTEPQGKEAAATWLNPDNLWVVIVGRASEIEPQIAKTGLRYEKIDFKDPISYAARARLRKQQQQQTHPTLPNPGPNPGSK